MRCSSKSCGGDIVFVLAITSAVALSQAAEVEVAYRPSDAHIANPERGFYAQLTAQSEGAPLLPEELQELRRRGITLVFRMYYLKKFRDKPLSPEQLSLVKQDFSSLRQVGSKCILRFAYSSRIGEPDAPLKVILQHVDQLEPLLRDNVDVIAVFQVGFIGAWGELHSSSNGLTASEPMRALIDRLLEALPSSRSVQVRTPIQKQTYVGSDQPLTRKEAFTTAAIARIGYHNDCFLADETDRGTYDKSRIIIQKRYLALDTRYVPMGGETCNPSKFAAAGNARVELSQLHWSYLNMGYHPQVLSAWRKSQFIKAVERRLGYRLSLVSSLCSSEVQTMGQLSVSMRLNNKGWAAPINPRDVFVVAQHEKTAVEYRAKLPVNPQYWLPDQPIEVMTSIGVPQSMPTGKYGLYLIFPAPEKSLGARPEYAIRLANEGLWDPETGKHDLNQFMTVLPETAELKYGGTIWFEPAP